MVFSKLKRTVCWLFVAWLLLSARLAYAQQQQQQVLGGQITTTQPAIADQVMQVVARIKQSNQLPATLVQKIQVVDSKDLNAATDGQTMFVTTTLWNAMKTDDQRAFVLSHEMAHILRGHVTKTQFRRLGFGLLDQFVLGRLTPDANSTWRKLQTASLSLLDLKFSRGMEYEADDLGFKLMSQARYNPKGAIEAFNILKEHTDGRGGYEFLQSHPLSESRIRVLQQKYQTQLQ